MVDREIRIKRKRSSKFKSAVILITIALSIWTLICLGTLLQIQAQRNRLQVILQDCSCSDGELKLEIVNSPFWYDNSSNRVSEPMPDKEGSNDEELE